MSKRSKDKSVDYSDNNVHDHSATTIYVLLQFVGTLTMRFHDLSNSLTSIIGNADLVSEQLNDFLDSPTAELCASLRETGLPALRDVIRKSREMARDVDALQEYAGQHPANTHTLDLNNAINETLTLVRNLLGHKFKIEFHPSDELPSIDIDYFTIDQLLLNILLTCKNVMPTGGSIIIETARAILDREFAGTHRGARPGTYTLLRITDSSPGLDSEQLTRVFAFPARETFDSAALSLQSVYSILKRFGGYISIESCPGNGTRFDVYLPEKEGVAGVHESHRTPLHYTHEPSIAPHGSLILVADDDPDIQQAIARCVSRAGYRTTFAADGETALNLYTQLTAEHNQPALLIADLRLPKIDGRQLSLTLQQLFPSARILLTSGYRIETNTSGKTSDGFGFLPKPFEPNALIAAIERLLKQ